MAANGKLHIYHPKRKLTLFEYQIPSVTNSAPSLPTPTRHIVFKPSTNVLLFIGGLYDNFLLPPYVPFLAGSPIFSIGSGSVSSQWTLMHVQLSSAMTGWGISNLDRDVEQLMTCITYIRRYVGTQYSEQKLREDDVNIVLMGHSTGCQDVLHYLYSSVPPSKPPRPVVQGAILQAPVSDRDALLHMLSTDTMAKRSYDEIMEVVEKTPKENWDNAILPMDKTIPLHGPTPVSISRFLSLASPKSPETPSMDDLFSSDLTEQRLRDTFGTVGSSTVLQVARDTSGRSKTEGLAKPSMLILISGSDEFMPPSIDKVALLKRWKAALESEQTAVLDESSSIVNGAEHDISGNDEVAVGAREDMRGRVLAYLNRVVGSDGQQKPAGLETLNLEVFKEVVKEVQGETKREELGKL